MITRLRCHGYLLVAFFTSILWSRVAYCWRFPLSANRQSIYDRTFGRRSLMAKIGSELSEKKLSNTRFYRKGNRHEPETQEQPCANRRTFLLTLPSAPCITAIALASNARPASARGLVQFPCKYTLMNIYHFMRSGQSLLEESDILSTNPLFLTNRENGLSDVGTQQVEAACQYLKPQGISPTIVGYSLAANCIDSANIVAKYLKIGQNRLVPEFTFLDPRAIGRWDGLRLKSTEEAMWAMDAAEAGPSGIDGRPPPNEDGTPNETLADQVTRLRQYLSGKIPRNSAVGSFSDVSFCFCSHSTFPLFSFI